MSTNSRSHIVYSLAMLVLLPQLSLVVRALLPQPPCITANVGGRNLCLDTTTDDYGGQGISHWFTKIPPGGFLKEIKGRYAAVIDSLTFTLDDGLGNTNTFKFGGNGGELDSAPIQFPKDEPIVGIKGIHSIFRGERTIITLYLKTKKRGWLGPIGTGDRYPTNSSDIVPYQVSLRDGTITELYGTSNSFINSIGFKSKPSRC